MSCVRTSLEVSAGAGSVATRDQHILKLKPFMVDMLEVVAVEGPAGGVECWMDIQKGVYPNVSNFWLHLSNEYRYRENILRFPTI